MFDFTYYDYSSKFLISFACDFSYVLGAVETFFNVVPVAGFLEVRVKAYSLYSRNVRNGHDNRRKLLI